MLFSSLDHNSYNKTQNREEARFKYKQVEYTSVGWADVKINETFFNSCRDKAVYSVNNIDPN